MILFAKLQSYKLMFMQLSLTTNSFGITASQDKALYIIGVTNTIWIVITPWLYIWLHEKAISFMMTL